MSQKLKLKITDLNVLVLNDTGYGHLCLGEIAEVFDGANIRDINKYKENAGYMVENPSMYGSNNNEIVSIASANNSCSSNTCNIKHGALSGQVSILSCITVWGQPDFSLDMGDPSSLCTNIVVLPGERHESSMSTICDGHIYEPHGHNTQVNFCDHNVSLSFSVN